jgi:TonB family protein
VQTAEVKPGLLQIPLPPPPPPPPPATPPPSNQRRRTIAGRTDRDIAVTMYAEGFRQKIETGAKIDALQGVAPGSYENPLVTVALRRDGSVEGVTIDRSSGNAQVDEAVRRIVMSLGPYARFPPGMTQDYDVVEIRRVWTFDVAVRLFAGGR